MSDPIADMIIRIKNAGMAKRASVSVPYSKLKAAIAQKLLQSGFVVEVTKHGKKTDRALELTLGYHTDGVPRVTEVHRISKPGRRVYVKGAECGKVKGGRGVAIVSTPKGILTGEEARKTGIGGEMLFTIA